MDCFTLFLLTCGVLMIWGFCSLVRCVFRWIMPWSRGVARNPPASSRPAQSASDRFLPARRCPRCGEAWQAEQILTHCPICGLSAIGSSDGERDPGLALDRMRRRVEVYATLQMLPQSVANVMREQLGLALSALPRPTPAATEARQVSPRETTVAATTPGSPERIGPPDLHAARAAKHIAESEPGPDRVPPRTPGEVLAPSALPEPRRKLLAAFLEESNIRWGELVGGLLIVGCSVALVLSFWSSIAQRPLLKYGLFLGVTSAVFGLGGYALRQWKLPSTARGLLSIGVLLIPLNFLAISSFERGTVAESAGTLLGEAAAIAVCGGLLACAGRALIPVAPWSLVLSVLGPSAWLFAIRRWGGSGAEPGEVSWLALAAVPSLIQTVALEWVFRGIGPERGRDEATHPRQALGMLGLSAFAVLLGLGLLLARSHGLEAGLKALAPAMPVIGLPVAGCGLRLNRTVSESERKQTYKYVVNTGLTLLGVVLIFAGMVCAWPVPRTLAAGAVVSSIVLGYLTWSCRAPLLHAGIAVCLGAAYLIASAVLAGRIGWGTAAGDALQLALLSGWTGLALVPAVTVTGLAALAWQRIGRRLEALAYGAAALGAMVVSVLLVTWKALGTVGDPEGATWVYAVYSIVCYAGLGILGRILPARARPLLAAGGWLLSLGALIQGVVFRGLIPGLPLPWFWAILAHAVITECASRLPIAREPDLREWFAWSGVVASLAAAVAFGLALPYTTPVPVAVAAAMLGLVWILQSWHRVWGSLWWLGQASGMAAVLAWATHGLTSAGWFSPPGDGWRDPRSLATLGLAGAMYAIALRLGSVAGARRAGNLPELARQLESQVIPSFKSLLTLALVMVCVGLAVYAALPGVAQELTPRELAARLADPSALPAPGTLTRVVPPLAAFELPGCPHEPARDARTWVLLALVAVSLVISFWNRVRRGELGMLVVVGLLAAPLLAAQWEGTVATASALRWLTAIFLLGGSALAWMGSWFRKLGTRLDWRFELTPAAGTVAATLLTGVLLPLVAMGVFVATTAIATRGVAGGTAPLWVATSFCFSLAFLAWLAFHQLAEDSKLARTGRPGTLLLTLLTGLPLVAVTFYAVASALKGNGVIEPEPGSLFARMGNTLSYVPPILMLSAALLGHAFHQRSEKFAFAAGLALNIAVTSAYVSMRVASGGVIDGGLWLGLAHANALASAAWALGWMAVLRRNRRAGESYEPVPGLAGGPHAWPGLLGVTVILGVVLEGATLLCGLFTLWLWPIPPAWLASLAEIPGVLALAATVAALLFWSGMHRGRAGRWAGGCALACVILAALGVIPLDRGNWLAFHVMTVNLGLAGAAALLLSWHDAALHLNNLDDRERRWTTTWGTLALSAVVLYALRGAWGADPTGPWWSIGAFAAMVFLAACLACWARHVVYLIVAAILGNLAANLAWFEWHNRAAASSLHEWIMINALVLALGVPAWTWIEERWIRPRGAVDPTPFTRASLWPGFAAWLALGITALGVIAGLLAGPALGQASQTGWIGALAILAVASAFLALGRAGHPIRPLGGLYAAGLCGVGWALHCLGVRGHMLIWTATIFLAAYNVTVSYLWSIRHEFARSLTRWVLPRENQRDTGPGWLVEATLLSVAAVLVLAFLAVLQEPDVLLRLGAGKAALAQGLAVGLLARGDRRWLLQRVALAVMIPAAVVWTWGWVDPASAYAWLDRASLALAVLVGLSALYGVGLFKLMPASSAWGIAARSLMPGLVPAAAIALVLVLFGEVRTVPPGGLGPERWGAVGLVCAVLLGGAGALIVAAIIPGRDPLGLSERGRTSYVYGAECLLALTLFHLKLTLPGLFDAWWAAGWALVLVAISFLGVGLAELFRRQGRLVLAIPLENTAALLPLLSFAAGFFWRPTPGIDALALLLAGAMYAALSGLRSRGVYSVFAAVAFNLALWTVLGRWEWASPWRHPQLWVIPPALCLLFAAEWHRARLDRATLSTIRYAATLAIYLSSTADIILTGVAHAPWLPLVLAALAIVGMIAGIALQVRGFLMLGIGFLGLAIFAMVWYAAVDLGQTWIWWLSGIITGGLILVIVALFEKKRQQLLEMVDRMRGWNG